MFDSIDVRTTCTCRRSIVPNLCGSWGDRSISGAEESKIGGRQARDVLNGCASVGSIPTQNHPHSLFQLLFRVFPEKC